MSRFGKVYVWNLTPTQPSKKKEEKPMKTTVKTEKLNLRKTSKINWVHPNPQKIARWGGKTSLVFTSGSKPIITEKLGGVGNWLMRAWRRAEQQTADADVRGRVEVYCECASIFGKASRQFTAGGIVASNTNTALVAGGTALTTAGAIALAVGSATVAAKAMVIGGAVALTTGFARGFAEGIRIEKEKAAKEIKKMKEQQAAVQVEKDKLSPEERAEMEKKQKEILAQLMSQLSQEVK